MSVNAERSVPIGDPSLEMGLSELLNAPVPDTREWCVFFRAITFFFVMSVIRAL